MQRPSSDADDPTVLVFPFATDARMRPLNRAFGVTPERAEVRVGADEVHVRFGPWSLTTRLDNIVDASVTGPYRWWKVAGPARLSLADRGVTFATSTGPGVCVRFREPMGAIDPMHVIRHPGMTVTVADPEALVAALSRR